MRCWSKLVSVMALSALFGAGCVTNEAEERTDEGSSVEQIEEAVGEAPLSFGEIHISIIVVGNANNNANHYAPPATCPSPPCG